jgi:hypothetical protein
MTELAQRNGHGPNCTAGADGGACVRCQGFQAGNQLGRRHGARAILALSSRAEEIREAIEEVAPVVHDSDGAILDLVSMALAQVEVAALVVSKSRGEQLEAVRAGQRLTAEQLQAHMRLSQDARGWTNSAGRLLDALGCTPAARARLGLDLASTRRTLSLIELHAAAAAERAEADVDGEAEEVSE